MIKPISALNQQNSFRGVNKRRNNTPAQKTFDMDTAMINACGLAASVGFVTTAITKVYASKWLTAIGMGVGASTLALIFMIPRFIEKKYLSD